MKMLARAFLLASVPFVTAGSYGQTAAPAPTAVPASAPIADTVTAKQIATMQAKLNDWAQLARYRADNAALAPVPVGEQRVVFYGDSITDRWRRTPGTESTFFPGKPYVNRGIGRQTTPQMLVRFEQDVVQLRPAVVVILGGVNDFAGATGPTTPEMIENNFEAMVAIARANRIKVVIASILPVTVVHPWKSGVNGTVAIPAMNERLKALCAREGLVYLDYYTTMVNARGGLDADVAADGVHPTVKGYAMMSPLAQRAIDEAIAKPDTATAKEIAGMQAKLNDWAQLARYRADNAALAPVPAGEQRVVFYGDSITDAWGRRPGTADTFFQGKPYVNRGISGQTTPQMVVRFRQDVIDLHPAAVVILAGTNDIAGNTGPMTPEMTEDNFRSMADLAHANGIKVILASITPAFDYPWKRGMEPAPKVRALNAWLKDYCERHSYTYLDYYSALTDAEGGMKPGTSVDGIHPNEKGYAIMEPLAQAAIDKTLASK